MDVICPKTLARFQTYEDFDLVLCFARRVFLSDMSGVQRFRKRTFPTIDVAKRKEDQPAIAKDRERRKVQCELIYPHGSAEALDRPLRSMPYRDG